MDEDYSNYLDWLQQQQGGGLLGTGDAPTADTSTTSALPDPNALYAQMQAQGLQPEYTAYKAGVTPDNMSPAGKAMAGYIDKTYPDAVITSTTDGRHAGRSMHGTGDALDVRTAGQSPEQIAAIMQAGRAQGATQLGYEGNHIHIGVGNNGGGAAFGPDKTAMSIGQAPGPVRDVLRAMQTGQPLNQQNPIIAATQGTTGGYGSPSGAAASAGVSGPADAQGPNDPRNPTGDARNFNSMPADPATTGPSSQTGATGTGTGAAGQGAAGKGKGDTNQDMLQKLAKGIMGFGALGAKGPYHFAPPVSGGSPVNRPDVASPDSYKAGARILPKIQLKGILG